MTTFKLKRIVRPILRNIPFFVAISILDISLAIAQVPSDVREIIERDQDRIQNKEQELFKSRNKQQKEEEPQGLDLKKLKTKPKDNINESCVNINSVNIEGASKKFAAKIKRLANRIIKEENCIKLNDINKVISEISNYYIDKGYILVRAYLPNQDLSKGILTIEIMEGEIEDIELDGKSVYDDPKIRMSFGKLKGKILNIRDLEQAVDQINRLESEEIKLDLLPGHKPGGTIVKLTRISKSKNKATLGVNNYGLSSTGIWQSNLDFKHDNLFNIYDILSITYSHDIEPHNSLKSSQLAKIGFEIPYNYWNFGIDFQNSQSKSTYNFANSSYTTKGNNYYYDLWTSRILARGANYKTKFKSQLTYKSLNTSNITSKTHVSDTQLTIWENSINHTQRFKDLVLIGEIGIRSGNDWLGATSDINRTRRDQHAQFNAYDSSLYLDYNIPRLKYFSLTSNMVGQYSKKGLYGTEEILAGSSYSVRGYRDESLQGDKGIYANNNLQFDYNYQDAKGFLQDLEWSNQIYTGFDWGVIGKQGGKEVNNGEGYGCVSGVGIGYRHSNKYFNFSMSLEKALNYPVFLHPHNNEFYMNLSVPIRF